MWKVLMLNKRCRKTHLFIEYEHRMYKVEEKMKIYQNVKENRKEMRREKVKKSTFSRLPPGTLCSEAYTVSAGDKPVSPRE